MKLHPFAVLIMLAAVFGVMVYAFFFAPAAHGATTSQMHHRLDRIHRQYVRDHGTVRFMVNHPWSRRHRRFMRIEKRAEHRIALERRERRHVRALLAAARAHAEAAFIAPWLATVACENSGQWSDSPGYFLFGLQFDPGTWATAAAHTGVYGTTPHDQVVNAIWTARHATSDPWPNCPDPYFG